MEDDQIPTKGPSDWQPITSKPDLAVLGKLGEELTECASALFRCIIQGIDEVEPETKRPNRDWLECEVADVHAMLDHIEEHFGLDIARIGSRWQAKYEYKKVWFDELRKQAKE
jgi:hypothetical protein